MSTVLTHWVSDLLTWFFNTRAVRFVLPYIMAWLNRIAWLVEYEPTWFPELGTGIALFGWGLGQALTDEIHVHGEGYILPAIAMLVGFGRCVVLMRRWYIARVMLASISALIWCWLFWAMAGRYGFIGPMGVVTGLFITDMLTACKFSIPCAREVYQDHVKWRVQR